MQLIGLTGKKRAGKDTACEMLSTIASPVASQRIGFADAVYEDLSKMLRLPIFIIKENKENFRLMLQGYATDYRRKMCGYNYWIERWQKTFNTIHPDIQLVIVPDVRFVNEADYIRKAGGVIWRIKRPLSEIDMHLSENELDEFQFPEINNNDSPHHMFQQLEKMYAVYSTQHPVA